MDDVELVRFTREFTASIDELYGGGTSPEALQRVVGLVADSVRGCCWASISDARVVTVVATHPIAEAADAAQRRVQEGPCLSAAREKADFYRFDVEGDARWPRLSRVLREETPVRSALALPLRTTDAALNLFADRPSSFSDEDITRATVFSAHVSALLALHESRITTANLQVALDTSRTIGTALGVLMYAHRIGQDAAFDLLKEASQTLNRKLRLVAEDIVETGALPHRPVSRRRSQR